MHIMHKHHGYYVGIGDTSAAFLSSFDKVGYCTKHVLMVAATRPASLFLLPRRGGQPTLLYARTWRETWLLSRRTYLGQPAIPAGGTCRNSAPYIITTFSWKTCPTHKHLGYYVGIGGDTSAVNFTSFVKAGPIKPFRGELPASLFLLPHWAANSRCRYVCTWHMHHGYLVATSAYSTCLVCTTLRLELWRQRSQKHLQGCFGRRRG